MAVHTRAATQQRASTSSTGNSSSSSSSNRNSNNSSSYNNRTSRKHHSNRNIIKAEPRKVRFRCGSEYNNAGWVDKRGRTTTTTTTRNNSCRTVKGSKKSKISFMQCEFSAVSNSNNNSSSQVAAGKPKKLTGKDCAIKRRLVKVPFTAANYSTSARKTIVESERVAVSKEVLPDICSNNNGCLSDAPCSTGEAGKNLECSDVECATKEKCYQRVYTLICSTNCDSNKDYVEVIDAAGKNETRVCYKNSLHSKVHPCGNVKTRRGINDGDVEKTSKVDGVGKDTPKLARISCTKSGTGRARVVLGQQELKAQKGVLPSLAQTTNAVTALDIVESPNGDIGLSEDISRCTKDGKMFQYSPNLSIPTRTTSTLTPTMLRNIQDSFVEYDNEVQPPLEHHMAAGFAPPSVIVQQFGSNTTNSSQGILASVVGTNQNSIVLEETPLSALQRERHDVEVKQEIIEEDAGWVQTPWANPGLLPSTTSRSGTAGDVTDSSAGSFQQTNLDFGQTSDVTRTSVPSESIESVVTAVASEDCNAANIAGTRRTASVNCPVVSMSSVTVSPNPMHEKGGRSSASRRKLKDETLPPEEEERKRQRRERNKLAAARCRQRRVDQTNELQTEVGDLEGTQKRLRGELDSLKQAKKELEKLLQQHSCIQQRHSSIVTQSNIGRLRAPVTTVPGLAVPSSISMSVVCPHASSNDSSQSALPTIISTQGDSPSELNTAPADSLIHTTGTASSVAVTGCHQQAPDTIATPTQVKVIVRCKDTVDSRMTQITSAPQTQQAEKRTRPTSLAVNMFEGTGIPVQTPSAGMYSFEGLIEGTGLTPGATPVATPVAFSPSCTTQQQRSNGGDSIQTPDSQRKLVTL